VRTHPGRRAYCWGQNDGGQLGDGTTTDRLTPTPVVGGLTFTSLAIGNADACGIGGLLGTTSNGAFGDGTVGTPMTIGLRDGVGRAAPRRPPPARSPAYAEVSV
jgi:hypothetical protein